MGGRHGAQAYADELRNKLIREGTSAFRLRPAEMEDVRKAQALYSGPRLTARQVLCVVSKFGEEEGLFVSWSEFKSNVLKEMASSFFRDRLWTRTDLLEALFANYDRLQDDLKAELPLKRIWTVAAQDGE